MVSWSTRIYKKGWEGMSTWRTRRLEELERNGILEYQEILEELGRNGNLENKEILEGLGRNLN